VTDDATTRNDLLELLDSLETWSRACQVYSTDDREARLRQARDEVVAFYFAGRVAAAAQPWTERELAKAMHTERLEREGCRSNYADERWDESKADRERWYASARVALSRWGGTARTEAARKRIIDAVYESGVDADSDRWPVIEAAIDAALSAWRE